MSKKPDDDFLKLGDLGAFDLSMAGFNLDDLAPAPEPPGGMTTEDIENFTLGFALQHAEAVGAPESTRWLLVQRGMPPDASDAEVRRRVDQATAAMDALKLRFPGLTKCEKRFKSVVSHHAKARPGWKPRRRW